MLWLDIVLEPHVLAIAIPGVGIAVAALIAVLRCSLSHRERMAMIARGLHPDDPRAGRDERDMQRAAR